MISRTFPDIQPLVSHPWTILTVNPPAEKLETPNSKSFFDRLFFKE